MGGSLLSEALGVKAVESLSVDCGIAWVSIE
jgi:hypothetical protein